MITESLGFKKPALFLVLLVGLFVLFTLVRVNHITADPPLNLTWSNCAFTDEGAYAYNARNKVLFGSWDVDGWTEYNGMYQTPIVHFLNYLVFSVLGVGFVQVRIAPIILSVLSLWLLYAALKDNLGERVALLSALFLGFNYVYVMYNRVGITETPEVFFMLLTFYLYQKGAASRTFNFLSGFFCWVTFVTKPYAFFFILAFFAMFLVKFLQGRSESVARRKVLSSLFIFLSGFLLALIVSLMIWYIPYFSEIRYYSTFSLTDQVISPLGRVRKVFSILAFPDSLWIRAPIITIFSFFYVVVLTSAGRKFSSEDAFFISWFALGLVFLSLLAYRPLRYFVPLIPPMCVLAARAWMGLWRAEKAALLPKITPGRRFWIFFWAWVIAFILLYNCLAGYFGSATPNLIKLSLGISFLVSVGLSISHERVERMIQFFARSFSGTSLSKSLCVGAMVAFFAVNGGQYLAWAMNPRYTLSETSKELERILPGDSRVMGNFAAELCLGNHLRCLPYFNIADRYKPEKIISLVETHGVTHLLLPLEDVLFYNPELFESDLIVKHSRVVKQYHIKEQTILLYAID
ncbi:MAG: glycosyltransferase family 39 protein [Actinomycetota bacterium]|nr:glycosyltransferase family 39 protein [Actinomycetota bacterium]